MADSSLRQRPSKHNGSAHTSTSKGDIVPAEVEDSSSRTISVLDILRVLITLAVASCALSYYLTSGDSILWNQRPWFTRPALLKAYLRGPLTLTPTELTLYNGTDPRLPIYLAINSTIFDVSAGAHTYGPGGSYNVFAGKHATRAFVTGCFAEDATNDMRGVEEMYIPIEDDEEEKISSGERKMRKEQERREARKKVRAEVEKWELFYGDSKKYFPVGKVVGEEIGSFEGRPVRALCEQASKGRPRRSKMNATKGKEKERANGSPGKPVQ